MGQGTGRLTLALLLWAWQARAGPILPGHMNCTRAAHTVEVPEAAVGSIACPEYFSTRSCCSGDEIASIWAKVEDMLSFVSRVMEDQKQPEDVSQGWGFEGDPCSDYYTRIFQSRAANYAAAREAVMKGADILQGSAIHLICAACFVCDKPQKTAQVEDFTSRAILSLQDRMGAIFSEQVLADKPERPDCALRYVTSLTEGTPFPAWGRFDPQMESRGLTLNETFIGWFDRVLSLLLELPGTLHFQQSLLQLALFYAARPGSDAFALLNAPPVSLPQSTLAEETPLSGDLCPTGEHRLLVTVPQGAAAEGLASCRETLAARAESWEVRWVVTLPAHVEALGSGESGADLIWRRFYPSDPDALASAICPERGAWVANFVQLGDCGEVGDVLQRLASEPGPGDLLPSSWPAGVRPARTQQLIPWPVDGFLGYLEDHASFVKAASGGQRPHGSRVLIYTCTSMTFCGGHGDRLNGMISAAVVAMLSGRLFFIDSQRPIPLALVLQPRAFDWRMYGTMAALPGAFNLNDKLAAFESDPQRVLDSQASVLRFVSNQRLSPAALLAAPQRAEALGLAPEPRLHARLFQALFEPSLALRQRLGARELPEGKLIGIHFRAGDQMPKNWKDPPRHSLDELDAFLDCAESLEASLGWKSHFVLFADTDKVLESPRVVSLRESGKLLWPAQPDTLVHLDRSPSTLTVRGLLGVWADWWTLAFDVHALVLCHSGFGATALEIGPERPARLGKGCVPADGST